MEIQYSKMILYGLIRAIFYIAIPLILITILSIYNIITFSQSFIISLIIIGIIGVGLTILKRMFPKDTMTNRLIAFAVAIYQGIYLFYLFGGFTPGVKLGTYYINTVQTQVLLGLQLIAWLLLGIAGVSAIQHLIGVIELRKKKEYRVKIKKEFKLSWLFKRLGYLLNIIILGYIISIIVSGLNLSFDLKEEYTFSVDSGPDGLPLNSDDRINITIKFDIINKGIYSIQDVYLNVDIFTISTTDPLNLSLPENVKIGEVKNAYYKEFPRLANTTKQITVSIFQIYALGLITYDADLELRVSLLSYYAGININLNTSIQTFWDELIV